MAGPRQRQGKFKGLELAGQRWELAKGKADRGKKQDCFRTKLHTENNTFGNTDHCGASHYSEHWRGSYRNNRRSPGHFPLSTDIHRTRHNCHAGQRSCHASLWGRSHVFSALGRHPAVRYRTHISGHRRHPISTFNAFLRKVHSFPYTEHCR